MIKKRYELYGHENEVHFNTIEECIDFLLRYLGIELKEATIEAELENQTEMLQVLLEYYFVEGEYVVEEKEEIERVLRKGQQEMTEREERERICMEMQDY